MTVYPQEYILYLVYFHSARDYFECHEVLEDYWKRNPESALKKAWVGLIQTAVSTYHHRRGNIKGALKMLDHAFQNLAVNDLTRLGIDAKQFLDILKERKQFIVEYPEAAYTDLNIPIADPVLLKQCMEQCSKQGLHWGKPSNMQDEQLIHKHTLRDRGEVISTRLKELQRRHLK